MYRDAPMEPGHRDRVITIRQRGEDTADPVSGEPVATWTDLVVAMPAAKHDIQGRERFAQEQLSARYDRRWIINYRLDMDPELVDVPKSRQVVYHGRAEDIVSAREIGRREGIELLTLFKADRV